MSGSSSAERSPVGARRGRRAPLALWALALALSALAAADLRADHGLTASSGALAAERSRIEEITNLRRDARKTYAATLELWLARTTDADARRQAVRSQAEAVMRRAAELGSEPPTSASEQARAADFIAAVSAWSREEAAALATDYPVASEPLRRSLAWVDEAVESLLWVKTAAARSDELALDQLRSLRAWTRALAASLFVALIGGLLALQAKIRSAAHATEQLRESLERYRALEESTNTVQFEIDLRARRLTYVSQAAATMLGCPMADVTLDRLLGATVEAADREKLDHILESLTRAEGAGEQHIEYSVRHQDGRTLDVRTIVYRARNPRTGAPMARGISFDVTRQRRLEVDLRHAQKLEAVGQMAAGVAHEINTPVQFVSDSVQFAHDAVIELVDLVASYRPVVAAVVAGAPATELATAALRAEGDADLDYLIENLPVALERSFAGLGRIATIVRAMKEFAHPGNREMSPIDLNRSIQNTVTIARSEYKYVAEVETDLGEVPPVNCYGGELNQALLNIIVNAAHAIGSVVAGSGGKGLIRIASARDGDFAVVRISDTGGGIPERIRDRIFEPFFTTKEVGKGTGQGLAVARSVIQDKHGGVLSFETEIGKGTTFVIRIPIAGRSALAGDRAA